MNRFVYLVHADYRDSTRPATMVTPGCAQHPSAKLARLRAELRRWLPDTQAKVSCVPIRRDPDVIQVTVVTSLDEAIADAAFVRFITHCNAALRLERPETS
jgi:hypothetical protein